jgi:hypothetical protein
MDIALAFGTGEDIQKLLANRHQISSFNSDPIEIAARQKAAPATH